MYEFSDWCFLCAREECADVEIKSLSDEIQEKISEFTIVNYNIPGCPSKICKMCLKFLNDIFYYTKRFESVEKFYIEVLKSKNKSVNLKDMKAKYNINDDEPMVVAKSPQKSPRKIKIQTSKSAQTSPQKVVQILSPSMSSFDEYIVTEIEAISASPPPVVIKKSPRKKSTGITILSVEKPKLLNPTIFAKIESKTRLDLLTCDLCEHTTSTKTSLEKHMENHIKNQQLYECKICFKKFAKRPILINHELTHKMSSERKTFQCTECGKHLSNKTAVKTHMKWHHEEKEFQCHVCLKDFATKGALNEHLKIHSDQKQHVCPICKKEYKTASSLSNHLDTHSNTSYECPQCGLKLNSKRTLRQHEKVHSNIIEHKCNICGAEFKRTKAFKEHLIIHSNIRPFKCQFCEKTFTNGSNCRKHMRERHPYETEEADRKGTAQKPTVKLPNINDLLKMTGHVKSNETE